MDNLFTRANTALDNSLVSFDNVHSSFGKIDPLPDSLLPVEKFDYRLLPDGTFADHVRDLSERMNCPPDYLAVAVMVVLGTVIGRSHQIKPKQYDDWTVVPNLWGLIIGSPSVMKTPALESIMYFLKRIDAEGKEQFDAEMRTYECDKEFGRAEREQVKKEAGVLLKDNKRDEARALYQSQDELEPPVRKTHFTNDSTIEMMGELESQNPNGLLLCRDEIHGFLRTIDSENRPNDRAFFLEGFNGTGSYRCDRIGRGTIDIKHHVISLLGTIQPGRFASYVHGAIQQGSCDDGFAQRFQLAVYPDESSKWVNVDRPPNDEVKDEAYSIVKKLADKAKVDEPVTYRFTPEAQVIFNEWLADLENTKLRNTDDHPVLVAHFTKYRSLLPSIALIIHLVDTRDTEKAAVSENAIVKACGWCDYLESHARRIYSDATHNPVKAAKLILAKIKSGKLTNGFSARELRRKEWSGLTDATEIREGLETLVEEGYLIDCVVATKGKPSVTFRIHPEILGDNRG